MTVKSKARRVRRRKGKGTVLLIALLFASSGVLRISAGAGDAFAGAANAKTAASEESTENSTEPMQNGDRNEASRPEMQTLLDALKSREARVIEREKQIEMRSKALAVANEEIDKRLVALEQTEAALRATLALADGAAEEDLARLTSVYESMKPKDAAALFEAMEPDFAAGFLGRMRPDAAAAVMAGLSPDAAYSISVILAGRNATVPKT